MPKYQAVLFAPDGEWVVDFASSTKEEVYNKINDRGSKWFFYPFISIILNKGNSTTSKQRLVEAFYPLEDFKGRSISSVSKYLKDNPSMIDML